MGAETSSSGARKCEGKSAKCKAQIERQRSSAKGVRVGAQKCKRKDIKKTRGNLSSWALSMYATPYSHTAVQGCAVLSSAGTGTVLHLVSLRL